MANHTIPAVALPQASTSLRPDFVFLVLYLFVIFFAPQERITWLYRPALILALLAFFFSFFSGSEKGWDDRLVQKGRQGILLALMALIFLFSIVDSPFPYWQRPDSLATFLKLIVLYFLIVNIVRTEGDLKLITGIILFFIAVIAAYSFLAARFGWENMGYRMTSPFGGMGSNSNGFAMFLLSFLPFFLMLTITNETLFKKALFALVSLLLFMCIIKTRSRMGFIALLFQFAFLAWMFRSNKKFLAMAAVLFLIPFLRANENYWERIQTIEVSEEMNVEDWDSPKRKNKWRQAMVLIERHPVAGVGLGQFRTAVETYHLGESKHIVHNAFLEIGAEAGIAAGVIFFLLLGLTARYNFRAILYFRELDDTEMFRLATGLFLSIVTFALCLVFLSEQYNSMLFVTLGLSESLNRLSQARMAAAEG